MTVFLSYSRDDKAWVYEFWRALRDDADYDVWIDQRIVPAENWWATICENIERCDCFIVVLTPHSVESIYCCAELDYALALNKPILPLLLKLCDIPESVVSNQIQYENITNDMPLDRVLLRTVKGLHKVEMRLTQGLYPAKEVSRPPLPKPNPRKPQQIKEVVALAEEAREVSHLPLEKELLQQVIAADPNGQGVEARKRLSATDAEKGFDTESGETKQTELNVGRTGVDSDNTLIENDRPKVDHTTSSMVYWFVILLVMGVVFGVIWLRNQPPALAAKDATRTSAFATYISPTETAIADIVRTTVHSELQIDTLPPTQDPSQVYDPLALTATHIVYQATLARSSAQIIPEETRIANIIRSNFPIDVSCDSVVTSELTPEIDLHEFRILLFPGGSVRFIADPVGDYLPLTMTLLDPIGNEVARDDATSGSSFIGTGILSAFGFYSLQITTSQRAVGTFSLSITCIESIA